MRWGVITFPGSCDDHDVFDSLKSDLGQKVKLLWHKDELTGNFDCIVLPGGFSYGDYLRCGAMARFSPIMRGVVKFAQSGGLVLGICNGFQILCESGLLPGALVRNAGLQFVCQPVHLRVEETDTPFTGGLKKGQLLQDAGEARRGLLLCRCGDPRAPAQESPNPAALRRRQRQDRRRQPIPTARWKISPVSAMKGAMSSA